MNGCVCIAPIDVATDLALQLLHAKIATPAQAVAEHVGCRLHVHVSRTEELRDHHPCLFVPLAAVRGRRLCQRHAP